MWDVIYSLQFKILSCLVIKMSYLMILHSSPKLKKIMHKMGEEVNFNLRKVRINVISFIKNVLFLYLVSINCLF